MRNENYEYSSCTCTAVRVLSLKISSRRKTGYIASRQHNSHRIARAHALAPCLSVIWTRRRTRPPPPRPGSSATSSRRCPRCATTTPRDSDRLIGRSRTRSVSPDLERVAHPLPPPPLPPPSSQFVTLAPGNPEVTLQLRKKLDVEIPFAPDLRFSVGTDLTLCNQDAGNFGKVAYVPNFQARSVITPVPMRPRSRCERRSSRTSLPGGRLSPPTPRSVSIPTHIDASQLRF